MAAEDSNLSEEFMRHHEESAPGLLSRTLYSYYQIPMTDQIYIAQSNLIKRLAQEGPCVIIGRCSDVIVEDSVKIYIHAPLAKRVEVYKGVVPVELGGDALGGAINIITDNSRRTRVNASYSFGSFNTHKTNAYAEHTTKSGFYVSLNAYQNYSDNDYKVNIDHYTKFGETGNSVVYEDLEVRRFHAEGSWNAARAVRLDLLSLL